MMSGFVPADGGGSLSITQGVSVAGGNGSGGNSLGHSDATQGSLKHGLSVQGTPVRVGLVADWEPSSAKRIDVVDSLGAAHRIAVVRILDDFYAIGDRCSHADISLAEGSIWEDECQIECFKHGSLFSLITGAPLTFPATKPVPVYVASVANGEVFVDLP
jgi:3-phenylpropionate/trans-cinnamate dioxygenase ferredoxin component